MDRVIVYALGKVFRENREHIDLAYDVIGYSDKDETIVKGIQNGISVKDIDSFDYDYILVASDNHRIAEELGDETGIPAQKIRMYLPYLMERSVLGNYFAEDREDLIVDRVFDDRHGDYSGVRYIDLGACSGIECNNTYYFYKRGGTGILVEADSSIISNLERDRSKDVILNRAVSDVGNQRIDFYVCTENRALSSLKKDHLDGWAEYNYSSQKVSVETITINEIFEMLNSPCDILSIDIEGYDYTVLKTLNFERYRPKVIIVEMLDTLQDRMNNEKIYQLLTSEGYILYAKTRPNGIFVLK